MASVLFIVLIPNSGKADSVGDSGKDVENQLIKGLVTPAVCSEAITISGSEDISKQNGAQQVVGEVGSPSAKTSSGAGGDGGQSTADSMNMKDETMSEPSVTFVVDDDDDDDNSLKEPVSKNETTGTPGTEPMMGNLALSTFRQQQQKDTVSNISLCSFLSFGTMEEILRSILESYNVSQAVWTATEDKKFYQVTFVEEAGERCEAIINKLANNGIGKKLNSRVSVIPISIHIEQESSEEESEDEMETPMGEDSDKKELIKEDPEKKTEFMKSIKSRLTVHQVVESVRNQAAFTFDFIMLISLASCIACLGLVENSSVILVASMLVSPLMGPILAWTFGTSIKNAQLRNDGIRREVIALTLCLVWGFLFGFIPGLVNLNGAKWGANDSWPTNEMRSRGMLRSLWVGVLVALPSGAGVALSILGSNVGSLVGVAISASLLPPAVNAGMLWSYALVTAIHPPPTTNMTESSYSGCAHFLDNTYTPVYSCNMAQEAGLLGIVSLCLTLVNILCIFVMGVVILKVKEVAPHTATSATTNFWKKDIKTAREYYSTMKPTSGGVTLGKKFLVEWNAIKKENEKSKTEIKDLWKKAKDKIINRKVKEEVAAMIENAENDPELLQVASRLPNGALFPMSVGRQISEEVYHEDIDDPRPYRTYTYLSPLSLTSVTGNSFRKSHIYDQHYQTLRLHHVRRRRQANTANGESKSEEKSSQGRFKVQRIPSEDTQSISSVQVGKFTVTKTDESETGGREAVPEIVLTIKS